MRKLALIAGIFILSSGFVLAQNPVADKNTQQPQSKNNQGQPITGKSQPNSGAPERAVTTTGSAGQTTPGAETEAGVAQQPGGNSDVRHTAPATGNRAVKSSSKTVLPPNPNAPGQTAQQADVNAQAASRAEIQPGSTLGVNGETNSARKPGEANQAGASGLPQTDQTAKSNSTNTTKKASKMSGKTAPHKKSNKTNSTTTGNASQPQ
jgi:hypothetical protein